MLDEPCSLDVFFALQSLVMSDFEIVLSIPSPENLVVAQNPIVFGSEDFHRLIDIHYFLKGNVLRVVKKDTSLVELTVN